MKSMAGIDIMNGKSYKSTYQILDELHDKWADLSDAEQAAITESIGGKRGKHNCLNVQQCAYRTHLKPVKPKALSLQCG